MEEKKMEEWLEYRQKIEDQQKLFEIETANKLSEDMAKEAAKYAKLAQLALNDKIEVMKNNLRGRWLYLTYPVKSAQKWLSMKDQELDKRKKYDEKDSFEYLTHKIEDLLDLKIEIKGISALGYDEAAYFIRFTLKDGFSGSEYELSIPETEKLNKNNLDELCEGKLKLMIKPVTSCCWNYICASYDKEELKNKFKEFLTPKPV